MHLKIINFKYLRKSEYWNNNDKNIISDMKVILKEK